MGQGNSTELIRDTIDADQFLEQQLAHHEVINLVFNKCVVPSTKGGNLDPKHLTEEERRCVSEYAYLYASQYQKGFLQFQNLFNQQQQQAMTRMRQEQMERMAREELHK